MIARSSTHTHTHTVGAVKRKGFTIIQLVIGMLIFAILTGIAFFGISVYTAQANETRVASDLGTFEVAIKDYMLNNPGACSDGTLNPVGLNHYLTKENALALDEADPNKDDLGTEISVAAGVKSEAAYKKLSVLEDPWGHQYRVVIRNNADRTTEDGEYGAKGTDRAFIYVYSMGKDGKGAANDTKQDDSVLCVQYSDGEVYSRSYLPSDGKNQAITAPAYTYWNKDENGKHSVMKDSIFAVGGVDPSKAPGEENSGVRGGFRVEDERTLAKDEIYVRLTTGEMFCGDQENAEYWEDALNDFLNSGNVTSTSRVSNKGPVKQEGFSPLDMYYHIGDDYFYVNWEIGDGWCVKAFDTSRTSYGPIPEEIAGAPVTSMWQTYYGCSNLLSAPAIPNSIIDVDGAFTGCTKLVGTTIVIPASVETPDGASGGWDNGPSWVKQ